VHAPLEEGYTAPGAAARLRALAALPAVRTHS
jgi:hypothetical protein